MKNTPISLDVNEWTVKVYYGPESCNALAEEWDKLFMHAVHASYHMTSTWVSFWIVNHDSFGSPVVLAIRRGGDLVGLLPLLIRRVGGFRVAQMYGSGHGYLGTLVSADAMEAADHLAQAVTAVADCIILIDVSSRDMSTQRFLNNLDELGWSVFRQRRDVDLTINLEPSYDDYLHKNKSAKSRSTMRYKERALSKAHRVNIEQYRSSDIIQSVVSRCAVIHSESWMKRRGGAFLCMKFYQRLVRRCADADLLDIWIMEIDGEDAAFAISGFAHGVYYYQWPAFKLKYESSLSIGQILLSKIIASACEDGFREFDFGGGDCAYKQFWSNSEHHVDRVVAGKGVRGQFAAYSVSRSWSFAKNPLIRDYYRRCAKRIRRLRQMHK